MVRLAASSDPGIPEPNKRHSGQTRRAATIFRKNWSKSLSCCFGLPIGGGSIGWLSTAPMDAIARLIVSRWMRFHRRSPHRN